MTDFSNVEVSELIEHCLTGDQEAMSALVEKYKALVYSFCYRMLHHSQDTEDVAQESFVRVFRSLHTFDQSRSFEPWLLAIAGNRCRTKLAKRAKQMHPSELVEDITDRSSEIEKANHLAEEVQFVLDTVRAEYRQAFLYFHEHELSYAEIAEMMQSPVGTIKTWVHRARKELIEKLQRRGVLHEVNHEA